MIPLVRAVAIEMGLTLKPEPKRLTWRALWEQVAEGQVRIPRTNDRLVLEWDVPDSTWAIYQPQEAMAQQLSLI